MSMKLIVGLGNPGLRYKHTRHNIGFTFVDAVAKNLGCEFKTSDKLKGMIALYKSDTQNVVFLKPQTFMNLSGDSVKAVADFYKIELADILIIYDDLDLPVAKVRIRCSGSSGGQKGMSSIISTLGSEQIKRLRIGIDKNCDAKDHVLGKFNETELKDIDQVIALSPKMMKDYLQLSFDDFMNRYNKNGTE